MLDEKDMAKLHQLKHHLLIVSLASMNREHTDSVEECEAFFQYVLIDSTVMKPKLKKLVILPPDSAIGVKNYYNCMRKHSKIVCQYISEGLIQDDEDIQNNWEAINSILSQASDADRTVFQSRDEANNIVR